MSSYTTNLQLFKYNTATDGKQVFSINDAMNDNWDKIDAFAKAIKDLSNLSSVGENRFTQINNELSQKLEAQVSLAQNGYIKFNNGIIIAFGLMGTGVYSVNFGISFTNIPIAVSSAIYGSTNNTTAATLAFLSGVVGLNGVTTTTLSRIGNSDSINVTRRYIAIGV